ncbi:FkbM family methyltransferase [Verrucomicrobium spinosum]|uniref:FkbM family methyltransferase n=1 Tax=Verrucomicrobium spinosum TaxID=2736 RepID=UPI0009463FA5|nr:FkbM family methyltransferase [Verrucomicrobium spinosum]
MDEVFISREYAAPTAAAPEYIIDAGANIGLTAIFYAITFPEATIIAIEPADENWDLLQRNASAYPKIKPALAALWPTKTRVNIANPSDASVSFFCSETTGAGTVQTVTVPELMEQHEMPHIDILKVDVEGAEKAIFSAAAPWIRKVRQFAIEFHDRKVPGCRASFEAVVSAAESECFRKGQTDHIKMKIEATRLNSDN